MIMIYATSQDSTQNAFTTRDGVPECSFHIFATREEFEKEQERIWSESKQRINLIEQDRNLFVKWCGLQAYKLKNSSVVMKEINFEKLVYEGYHKNSDAEKIKI